MFNIIAQSTPLSVDVIAMRSTAELWVFRFTSHRHIAIVHGGSAHDDAAAVRERRDAGHVAFIYAEWFVLIESNLARSSFNPQALALFFSWFSGLTAQQGRKLVQTTMHCNERLIASDNYRYRPSDPRHLPRVCPEQGFSHCRTLMEL